MAPSPPRPLPATIQVIFLLLAVTCRVIGSAQVMGESVEGAQGQEVPHSPHTVHSRQSWSSSSYHVSSGGDHQQQVPQKPPARQLSLQDANAQVQQGSREREAMAAVSSRSVSQARGSNSAQSGYGYGSSSSEKKTLHSSSGFRSGSRSSSSSSSSYSESSQRHTGSESSGNAGYDVSGSAGRVAGAGSLGRSSDRASAAVNRESQSSHARSAHSSSQRSQNAGRQEVAADRRRQHRPDSVGAVPQNVPGSSADVRASSGSQSSAASGVRSASSVKVTSADSDRARQSVENSRGRQSLDNSRGGQSSAASSASRARSSASRAGSEVDRAAALSSDREDRSYYRQLFSRRCKDCALKGKTYSGHSRFEYSEGCQRFRCICHCNGSHTCPPKYTLNVCGEGEENGGGRAAADVRDQSDLRRRRCQTCEVLGQQFKGNAYFDYQDGCTKYRGCVCYCNGTWECPGERAINTCPDSTTTPPSACRACNAKGKIVAANTVFELEEPCRHYRHCRCYCNGTWDCPARFAQNTCHSPTARPQEQPGCGTCSIPGKQQVQGNTYFERKEGCVEYKNCVCRCNGSWTCPSQYARNTCLDSGRSGGRGSAYHLPASSSECQSCLAHGRYFRGNTYFNTRRGCTSYERCVCRCDGSWDCPNRYITDLCRDDDPSNDADNPNATCSFCDADGKIVPPNSFFNLTKPCVQYMQCLCHCDGGWTCPEMFSRDLCDGQHVPQQPEPERDCSSCLVNSRVVRGNSYFDYTSACYRYRGCLCKCDGTYHCEEGRAQNICNYSTTADALSSPSSSASSSSPSQVVVTPAPSCVRCLAFGQLQDWDRDFVHEEDCVEYECHCHCNGTYTCPMDRARRTCQPGCRECEVGGQFFEGNTYFQHTQGCVVFLCTCFCNGSYSCPPERANNTCQGREDPTQRPDPGSHLPQEGGMGARGECQQCVTNDGVSRASGSSFELHEGCIHYQCQCHCDGSWTCPGQHARNICRGEVLGGCRSCVLSDSQIYRGGEEFQMRDGCIHYKCQCNCDGSWQCPGDQARDICLGEVPGGCRVCRVSKNETYRGGSSFQLRQGCHHYQCQCRCNGSWECPGDTARDVCIGEVPGGCRVCKLDSGEIYLGESDFQMVKQCIHYNCRCNCDGSWNCPGERARRVCNPDGSPLIVPAETTTRPPASSCRRCVVSDEESFPHSQAFTLRRGCNVYQCDCDCDGSWNCPPSLATNICRRRDDPQLRARTCSSCQVSGYTYPGRSTFLLTRGCAQYSCHCDCRGRWTCDHRVARNICQDDRQGPLGSGRSQSVGRSREAGFNILSSVSSDRSPQGAYRSLVSDVRTRAVNTARGSSVAAANLGSFQVRGQVSAPCRPCRVESQDYDPNTDFVLNRKCKRFHCHCSCNGRWRCPRDRAKDLCADDRYNKEDNRRVGSAHRESDNRRAASAHFQPLSPEAAAGANRYGRANIRVVGANSAFSSSSSSSGHTRREGEQGYGELNVRGYYVNSARQSHSADDRQAGQQFYGQADKRQVDGQLYGPADYRRNSQQSSGKQVSGSANGARSMSERREGEEGGDACTLCLVDDKRYPTGAHFDWRRGCVVYKCTCLCSGSYRCRLSVDPDCREEEAPSDTGGIPTGPAVGGRPAGQPGGSCGNCYVQGLVYPGNMSFTLRQGCKELSCHCGCNGKHQCADQKPIPGCVAMATPLGNAVYPNGASSSVYPVGAGEYGARPGRVINTFQQTYYSNCPSCGQGQEGSLLIPALLIPQQPPGPNPGPNLGLNPGQDPGQDQQAASQYRYPLAAQPQQQSAVPAQGAYFQSHGAHPDHSASQHPRNPQYPINPQSFAQSKMGHAGVRRRTSVQRTPLQPVAVMADGVVEGGEEDHMCATCFVNGQSRRGDFHYIKDCSHVTCHCDCAGRLHCSVQLTRTADCLPQPHAVPVSGECSHCLVQSQPHPPNLQFTLRVGCYGYACTCGCDGSWVCPRQQPTNYCVQPARPPTRVTDDRYPGRQHDHHAGKAGLKDATYSQSAELQDSLLKCQDCDVRGTTYPSRTRFLLRQDCLQHMCDCACDGSWTCAKNLTIDVCKQGQRGDHRQQPEGGMQEEREQGPRGELAEVAARKARVASLENCQDCRVKGDHFLPNAQFEFRQGCRLFTCHCFCNGSWDCPVSLTRNVCQGEELLVHGKEVSVRPAEGCHPCQWGNATYAGGSNFSHTEGCWQFDCSCGCNGRVTCPPDASRDLCRSGDSQALRQRLRDNKEERPLPLDCRPCLVDGQMIRSRTAFNRREGCWEFLCQCQCNGSWTCPQDRSLNTCQLDTDSALSAPSHADRPLTRTGCTVGRKTYFTRLFAFRDGCVQHMCICYDSGAWRCPQGKERRLC